MTQKISKDWYKRVFDIGLIVVAHILLFPVWLLLWILIPLFIVVEDGLPIFYKQRRMGKDRRIFIAYKFRTMVKDAEKMGPIYTLENDSRILKIGKILRATGLDELPQLWNILKGDMSFVGPRPLVVEEQIEYEEKIKNFDKRLEITPGLTGPAQLLADRLSKEDWLKYDLAYIEKMNLWLDFKIIVLSVLTTLFGGWDRRGARAFLKWGLKEFSNLSKI